MIGQTISHYQVKRELGRGGMGVVYLAEDLRLGRQVAIKVLPPELSRDPLRRKRFEQEARACAVLSHSAIASVFDLEEVGDELFIIFEYVDGEDLRALLQRGALPASHLLKLAQSLGQGLAAAHQAGIIHRDLKPENIRVTSAGQPKILDFGLARMQPELLSAAATFSFAVTQHGSIVGTVGYMSPEQLESRELDARSDIFSFGVILYEMAAGVHPFQGESPASTIANVLTKDPAPVEHLNPVQPPALDCIIRKCLAKKKEQRYQSVIDLLLDLEDVQRKSDDTMKTVVITSDPAVLSKEDSESLLASAFARAGANVRLWWEIHHLFMAVAVPAIFPYLAWFMRGSSGGQLDLLFFFMVVTLSVVNFVFRGGMLLSLAFDPAKKLEVISRMGPKVRLTHVLLCVAVVLFTPTFVSQHPLLGTLFAGLVIGGILVTVLIEPWIERNAFPDLGAQRDRLKNGPAPVPRWDDIARLAAIQLLYASFALLACWEKGRYANKSIQWLTTPQADKTPLILGIVFLLAAIAALLLLGLFMGLLQRRPDVVLTFKRWFVLFAGLDSVASVGLVDLLDRYTNLIGLSIGMGIALYGVRYQWLLAKRILAEKTEAVKSTTAG